MELHIRDFAPGPHLAPHAAGFSVVVRFEQERWESASVVNDAHPYRFAAKGTGDEYVHIDIVRNGEVRYETVLGLDGILQREVSCWLGLIPAQSGAAPAAMLRHALKRGQQADGPRLLVLCALRPEPTLTSRPAVRSQSPGPETARASGRRIRSPRPAPPPSGAPLPIHVDLRTPSPGRPSPRPAQEGPISPPRASPHISPPHLHSASLPFGLSTVPGPFDFGRTPPATPERPQVPALAMRRPAAFDQQLVAPLRDAPLRDLNGAARAAGVPADTDLRAAAGADLDPRVPIRGWQRGPLLHLPGGALAEGLASPSQVQAGVNTAPTSATATPASRTTTVTAAGAAPEAYLRLEDRPVLFPRGDPEGGPASREYPHHLRRAETLLYPDADAQRGSEVGTAPGLDVPLRLRELSTRSDAAPSDSAREERRYEQQRPSTASSKTDVTNADMSVGKRQPPTSTSPDRASPDRKTPPRIPAGKGSWPGAPVDVVKLQEQLADAQARAAEAEARISKADREHQEQMGKLAKQTAELRAEAAAALSAATSDANARETVTRAEAARMEARVRELEAALGVKAAPRAEEALQELLADAPGPHGREARHGEARLTSLRDAPVNADRVPLRHAEDRVAHLIEEQLRSLGVDVQYERFGPGKYMFGSRKVFCKVYNNRLMVRVGGGYIPFEEFVSELVPPSEARELPESFDSFMTQQYA